MAGHPSPIAMASLSALTVSPVMVDQWPGAPGAGVEEVCATARVGKSAAMSEKVRGDMGTSVWAALANAQDFASPRASFPLTAAMAALAAEAALSISDSSPDM